MVDGCISHAKGHCFDFWLKLQNLLLELIFIIAIASRQGTSTHSKCTTDMKLNLFIKIHLLFADE